MADPSEMGLRPFLTDSSEEASFSYDGDGDGLSSLLASEEYAAYQDSVHLNESSSLHSDIHSLPDQMLNFSDPEGNNWRAATIRGAKNRQSFLFWGQIWAQFGLLFGLFIGKCWPNVDSQNEFAKKNWTEF